MSFQNFIDKFMKMPLESKLNVLYTELMIIKDRMTHEFDDRPANVIAEFPLRQIPLDICICGHGDQDHLTDIEGFDVEDGMCAKCVCRKFISQIQKDKSK